MEETCDVTSCRDKSNQAKHISYTLQKKMTMSMNKKFMTVQTVWKIGKYSER
jgi:hypothetical protein